MEDAVKRVVSDLDRLSAMFGVQRKEHLKLILVPSD